MDNYSVQIWEMEGRGKQHGPDFLFNNVIAKSPELALQKTLIDNKITVRVYAEVIWNNGQDRQKFEDYLVKI